MKFFITREINGARSWLGATGKWMIGSSVAKRFHSTEAALHFAKLCGITEPFNVDHENR